MSSTFREIQLNVMHNASQWRFWVIMIAMILLFALIGPFGTFERLSLPMRLIYWTVTMLGSWAIAIVTIGIVDALLAGKNIPQIAIMGIGAALAAFPMAGYLYFVIPLLVPLSPSQSYWDLFGYALPISLAFSLIVYFSLSGSSQGDGANGAADLNADQDNALQMRLSPQMRGPVQHMSMQDHYISVTTSRGTELVLMRMADAVAALNGQDGLQIHRSHWVAKNAVVDSKRENGQPIVVVTSGDELPVSRTYTKAAKEAGVI